MAEATPAPAASEANQTVPGGTEPGPAVEGAPEGTTTPADPFAGERETLTVRARSFQGEADRQKARADELERKLSAAGGTTAPAPVAAPSEPVDVGMILELFEARNALKEKFPEADPAVLKRYRDYGSVDEMFLAVEASHRTRAAENATIREGIEAQVRAEYEAKHGPLQATPATPSGATPTGDLTFAQIAAMTPVQMNELELKHPGMIERVARAAQGV